MAARLIEKTHLSAKGLIGKVRSVFKKVKEPPKGGQGQTKSKKPEHSLCYAYDVGIPDRSD